MAFLLRTATPADSDRIALLAGQLGHPASAPGVRQRLEGLAKDPHHLLLVADSEGRTVLGWAHACRDPSLLSEGALLTGLVVDEAWRSQGLGALLLRAVERWAVERGEPVLRLRSRLSRERAHAFYLRQGYSLLKTQHVFQRDLPRA